MRTIGLLGGMSWESTREYYRIVNQETARRLGKFHSAPVVLYSLDFARVKALQDSGDWKGASALLQDGARAVERAGAGMLLICANTMHKLASEVQSAISIPLIHGVEATAIALKAAGVQRAGLIGTRFTMREGFFKDYMQRYHRIEPLVPPEDEQEAVDDIIYNELCLGEIRHQSRAVFRQVIRNLKDRGAEAVVLGCTEIGLLIGENDVDVPLFDTTEIHATAAVDEALREGADAPCSRAS